MRSECSVIFIHTKRGYNVFKSIAEWMSRVALNAALNKVQCEKFLSYNFCSAESNRDSYQLQVV